MDKVFVLLNCLFHPQHSEAIERKVRGQVDYAVGLLDIRDAQTSLVQPDQEGELPVFAAKTAELDSRFPATAYAQRLPEQEEPLLKVHNSRLL